MSPEQRCRVCDVKLTLGYAVCPSGHVQVLQTLGGPGGPFVIRDSLDLASTSDLLDALERRFDALVLAGTILISTAPGGNQEQRVVRRKGHDLVGVGLVHLLLVHCQPHPLPEDREMPIGGRE